MGLGETIRNNPKIGWGVSLVLMVAAGVLLTMQLMSGGPADSTKRLSEDVTLRCTETGEEWTMNRGQFELQLLTYQGELTKDGYFPSPFADGRPTAILVNRAEWEATVERINAAREQYSGRRRTSGG